MTKAQKRMMDPANMKMSLFLNRVVLIQVPVTMTRAQKRMMDPANMKMSLWIMELDLSHGGRKHFFAILPNK